MNEVLKKDSITKNTPKTKKFQTTVSLPTATYSKIKSLQALNTQSEISRNQIIEQAIDFYFGYKTSELNQDYLCSVIGQKIEGMLNNVTDRTARLQFKEAVEMNLLTRLIASQFDIDKMTYEKMRKTAVDDVKSTKGIINIYDAQR
ncbi:hypothetical protein [Ruminococcus sp.]|uniref:hypothetical protein n=1 Tax=Ruminococcus sp. TaxID=41978 RepID=UPI00260F9D57|nr:hypothetical protein [Ruminococcus sp.]MDD6988228.1 hypothetical protein [Ruminococcus sp.]MDY6201590.1 hypothetical protein [Ruminococcus sp.]